MENLKKNPKVRMNGTPPFPWVGGKRRLLPELIKNLPNDLDQRKIYVEPFVGGGALFFWIRQHFPHLHCIINDSNEHLINVYRIIRDQPSDLLARLELLQQLYEILQDRDGRRKFFMEQRASYNAEKQDKIKQAALFIFLMRTCYNGVYSVNRHGQLTMTFGNWQRTRIADKESIFTNSRLLQDVEILNADFEDVQKYITPDSFVYFDPPYKPVNENNTCTAYMPTRFNDPEQIRLAEFCTKIGKDGTKWMLSNSDPREKDPRNTFFDDLYAGYRIQRLTIFRSICSIAEKRATVNELLITNY